MPQMIEVIFKPMELRARVPLETTIAEACKAVGINLDLPCGGLGKCGKCLVEVIGEGTFTIERACSFRLQKDAEVKLPEKIINREYQIFTAGIERPYIFKPKVRKFFIKLEENIERESITDWEKVKNFLRQQVGNAGIEPNIELPLLQKFAIVCKEETGFTITLFQNSILNVEKGDTTKINYGMAFDIGTTTVVGYLIDNNSGREVAVVSSINRQVKYGADVISRITAATSEEGLKALQKEVVEVLNELAYEAANKASINLRDIYEIILTGNTTMHHLLLGLSPVNLGRSPFMPVIKESLETTAEALALRVNPWAKVTVFPVIAGFVGGDTVAVILATNQHKAEEIRLLIDIGTNGELVLGSKERLITCSTAAGPAFEGARLTWGMRGAPGAIERVTIEGDVSYKTIDNLKPKGICGSGIIDLVAEMLKAGIINYKGRIVLPKEVEKLPPLLAARIDGHGIERRFIVAYKNETEVGEDIIITQSDIQELQLAKGAIKGAIEVLMGQLQLDADNLKEILLAGAFGSYIDVEKAKRIGLVPDFPRVPVKAIGNAAGIGAKLALLSTDERQQLEPISQKVEFLELAQLEAFHSEYVKGMYFPQQQEKSYV